MGLAHGNTKYPSPTHSHTHTPGMKLEEIQPEGREEAPASPEDLKEAVPNTDLCEFFCVF